jgi:hypothetical protein
VEMMDKECMKNDGLKLASKGEGEDRAKSQT